MLFISDLYVRKYIHLTTAIQTPLLCASCIVDLITRLLQTRIERVMERRKATDCVERIAIEFPKRFREHDSKLIYM